MASSVPRSRLPPIPYIDLNLSLSKLTLSTQEAFLRNYFTIQSLDSLSSNYVPSSINSQKSLIKAPNPLISSRVSNSLRIPELFPNKTEKIGFLEKGKYQAFLIRFKDKIQSMKFNIINSKSHHFLVFFAIDKPASKIHHNMKFYQESFVVTNKGFSVKKPVFLSVFALTALEEFLISFEFLPGNFTFEKPDFLL